MNHAYRSRCSVLWRGLVLLALSAVLVAGCMNSRRARLSCENTTSGLARVSVIEEPYAFALELARAMPEAFLTEFSQPNAWFEAMPVSTQVAIRAVLAEFCWQWADDLRSSVAASEPIARVRAYPQALLRRVVNTCRTGEQPPWHTHSSEVFPGYTESSRGTQSKEGRTPSGWRSGV